MGRPAPPPNAYCIGGPRRPPPPPRHRKSIERRGPGFGYGFIVAMCFTLGFFTLLCGLVLNGFDDVVSRQLAANRECLGC